MKCPYCGKEIASGSLFCDGCGAKLDAENQQQTTYSPDAFSYQGGNQPAPKKKTGLILAIVIISVLLVAGIIVGVILLTGGKKDENNSENNEVVENNEKDNTEKGSETDSKIKYTEHTTKRNSIVLIVKNNNSKTVDVEFDIDYYDANNVIVGRDTEYLYAVPANYETVIEFRGSDKAYDHYKITYKSEKTEYNTSHFNDVKLNVKELKEDEEFEVVVSNSAKENIESIEVAIVFYKDGKVVGFEDDFDYDIPAGQSVLLTVDYPYDSEYETIEFDEYKAYLTEAYSHNYSY